MVKPLGYYTNYDPQTQEPAILHNLQERFGSQLQQMTYEQKIVMRAALTGFIAQLPVWEQEGSSITCIDACIESAGVDWGVWEEDQELCEYIQACSQLSEGNIENLIEALTAQIQGKQDLRNCHMRSRPQHKGLEGAFIRTGELLTCP